MFALNRRRLESGVGGDMLSVSSLDGAPEAVKRGTMTQDSGVLVL